tara:strand:- start:793 stop:1905 length:1113 start_codon:yes stop_codon:yes gene_type:complete
MNSSSWDSGGTQYRQAEIIAEEVPNAVIEYSNWCADNALQCSLATLDFLPVVGTLARCGQLVVQALDGDIGEDTAFNCELNAAGDLIPIAGKFASKGYKVAAKAAKATTAAATLRTARTAAAKTGMTQAEKNAALMELGRASEDYTKVVAREIEQVDKVAAETLRLEVAERDANQAARVWLEDQKALGKIKQLLKEGAAKHEAEVAASKRAVEREEGIQVAKKRGVKENKLKDASAARKLARYAKLRMLAQAAAEPALTVLNCREGLGDLAVHYATSHYGELPPAYTLNPQCPEVVPPDDDDNDNNDDNDYIIPPGGPEDRKQPALDPDFITYNQGVSLGGVVSADRSSVYLLLGVLVVVGAGTYAYYKF